MLSVHKGGKEWVTRPPTTGVGEDVGKKEPLYTAGGNASWCNHSGKQYGGCLKI
jgi:hypothetical protein